MKIAIIGASGFVGNNLIKCLLKNTNYSIRAICLDIENIKIEEKYKNRVEIIRASVFEYNNMLLALLGVDVAYYLIHMMASDKDNFYKKEELAATITGKALKHAKVKRVIYMSGLGNDNDNLSNHLSSRHNTGNILREYIDEVIELRASMIIGEGSISFEIVKNIVDKSPIILLPKWSITKTQPIGIDDALLYLKESITLQISKNEIIEIGGNEIMSYEEFIRKYAKFKNKKTIILRLSILPEKVAGIFLKIFMKKDQAQVGQCMLDSFRNEMIVTNNKAKEFFPNINPRKIEDYFI